MSKIRNLTCIVCPRGCSMTVTLSDEGVVEKVEGNFCRRGIGYANDECTNPRRTVTSTVRTKNGGVVAVKTLGSVPKVKMFEVMAEINSTLANDNVKIGDVLIENVCDTGINVVVTGKVNS